jgi:drug/metabolite transporter (DMT)-like permease
MNRWPRCEDQFAVKINSGILAAFSAAALFGLSTPLAKILVADIDPLLLSGLLYTGSGVGLLVLLAIKVTASGWRSLVLPRGTSIAWLFLAALFGGALGPFLLMRGLTETDSASASLTLNLEGVFTALLAWFVFKENFDRRILLGMACIVAGGVALSLGAGTQESGMLGPVLIAAACLAWAVDNNVTRKVSTNDAMVIACSKGLIAGPFSIALALKMGVHMPVAVDVCKAAVLGFLGYGLSLTLFVLALRNLGTARTGAYFSMAPFIGAILAIALGAPVTVTLCAAGLLMGVGVWLHLTENHMHRHVHLPLTHEHSHSHDIHHRHFHGDASQDGLTHSHVHVHEALEHGHAHYPDIHHRHEH